MPIFDLPLEELHVYQGINPRPNDFDAYWEAALQELQATDPDVKLVLSRFQTPFAECFDLYFTGVRGARIHAQYLRPKKNPAFHPAVLQFHGYSGNAGDWSDKLTLVAAGYSVVAMDCRGQGGSSEDIGGVKGNTLHGHLIRGLDDATENLLFRQIFLDTVQLARVVMHFPEVDPQRVGVMGQSQGGGLALACAALEPRIKRVMAFYPFLCDYRRVWELDLAAQDAYAELCEYFRRFDPQHQREDQIYTKLGYIDVQHLAKWIQGEVLFITGLMDTVCPPSTQFAAYNKIKAPKRMALYPDFRHAERYPGANDEIFEFMMGL
jgi:cephalosporin-C deacetylase